MKKGFFGIGIYHPSKEVNIGTLFRSAYAFGADFIYTIGRQSRRQSSDTVNSDKHIPYYQYNTLDDLISNLPKNARLVCIENYENSRNLQNFCHPEQAVYLLGNEGSGLPKAVTDKFGCVNIPCDVCINVSTAGSIVMYDRRSKVNHGPIRAAHQSFPLQSTTWIVKTSAIS